MSSGISVFFIQKLAILGLAKGKSMSPFFGSSVRNISPWRCSSSLRATRSEEHTSELQSLMRISYAVFCLKKKKHQNITNKSTSLYHNNHKTYMIVYLNI